MTITLFFRRLRSSQAKNCHLKTGRCLSDENLIKINQKIELADLAFLDEENDINENWLKFKETLLGIIDDVAPLKNLK